MRVMLINPPIDCVLEEGHVSPVTQYLFYNSAPLGILYIASMLEDKGHEVSVIDAAAELLDVESTTQRIQDWNPDVIGIGSFTVTFDTTCRLANKLKETLPDVPIILGSYHVTLVPHEAMSHDAFDVGVINEGEFTMLELVNYFAEHTFNDISGLAEINGIVYRKPDESKDNGYELVFTKPRAKFKDLDKLPKPARHLIPKSTVYKPVPIDNHGMPKYSMITSRGCPHLCAFCQKSRTGYRSHSAKYVVDEMQELVEKYGAKDIAIVDSLFCANKRRVHEICDEILSRGLETKLSWTCSSRVEVVDRPLLEKMKKAGCWRTRFGIESGHDTVLDFISKGITQEKIKSAITAAHEVGLRPKAFFMVGHMPDTRETILETIRFAKSIPLHDITVQINTLLPETPQLDVWNKEGHKWGRIVSTTKNEKSFWEPTFVPWGLESDDLIELHRQFYREFYLRPTVLRRHVESINGLDDIMKYVEAASLFTFLFFDLDPEQVGNQVKQKLPTSIRKPLSNFKRLMMRV